MRAGEGLLSGKLASIHRPSEEEEQAAFAYFKRHDDQVYSFVDCLSFVVMERLGIREAEEDERIELREGVSVPTQRRIASQRR